MLDFRIGTFISVCKYMNFTRASEALNITQPAVSQHIHYLEEFYETKLFWMNGKKVCLTDSGKRLLDKVITMQNDIQHLKSLLSDNSSEVMNLNFGVTLTLGDFLLPEKLAAYYKQFPEAQVNMRIQNTHELLQLMEEGTIDFAIIEGYFSKKEYDYLLYQRERFIAVCAAGHKFAEEPKRIADLLNETLILRERNSGGRAVMQKNLDCRNLSEQDFSKLIELNDINAIKALTAWDCGITFLYEAAARNELKEGILQEIPLEDFQIKQDMSFIWRKDSMFAEHYKKIYQLLK